MIFSATEIAHILNGKIEGDTQTCVSEFSKIEAGNENSISFLANPKYESYIYTTKSAIVIVNDNFIAQKKISCTLIRVPDPYTAFATLMEKYQHQKTKKRGIAKTAIISPTATIGDNCYIGDYVIIEEGVDIGDNCSIYPQAYIGANSKIGSNSTLYMGVKILHNCILGYSCVVHAGTVIGSDGFGFAPQNNNEYMKIPQLGNVVIEENVEIGSNCTIDRATIGATIIRRGTKLDNLIQIGHNVEIGENCVIAAQCGISGSTKIGKNIMMGGQVGIAGHLTIADNIKIGGQTGITGNIKKEGITIFGTPAIEIANFRRSFVYFKNLSSLANRIDHLEKLLYKKD